MSAKVRLASIGIGWWGNVLADAALRAGNIEIVSGYARTPATREKFAEKYGCRPAASVEAILADPTVEGVISATPHDHHLDFIKEAAAAGKHVFVEKPLTLYVAEAREAIAACAAAGVLLQVGHHRRKLGATRRLKEMIAGGELGLLHQLNATLNVSTPNKPGWRSDPAQNPLGGLTGLGVHMIDNVQYLAGPIKRVFTFSKQILARNEHDDATVVVAELESGPLAMISFSLVLPKVATTSVYGYEAAAWSENDGANLYVQRKDEFVRRELACEAGDALADQLREFAAAIRGEAQVEVTGEVALGVVAVMEALYESHRSGKPADVADYR